MYDVLKELNIPLPRKYYDGQFVNINWETIPSKCVIKPTTLHSAQGVYLFDNDIEKTTGKKILYPDRKKFILNDLGNQVNKCNWVIEEYLEDYDSNYDRARDFKCYVGGGKVWFVLVYERNKQNNKAKHYTRNWLPIKKRSW